MVVKTGLRTEGLMSPAACPVGDERLAEAERRAHLARDCHDDQIAPVGVVAAAGNDDGGPLLRARLVRERKRHQNHIAEEMRHRYMRS